MLSRTNLKQNTVLKMKLYENHKQDWELYQNWNILLYNCAENILHIYILAIIGIFILWPRISTNPYITTTSLTSYFILGKLLSFSNLFPINKDGFSNKDLAVLLWRLTIKHIKQLAYLGHSVTAIPLLAIYLKNKVLWKKWFTWQC
jgi:hypothetical protein